MSKLVILSSMIFLAFAVSCETRPEAESESFPGLQEVEQGFAEVNGTRLYYEAAGSGDPIVLIHGNFGDRRHWDDQFEALAESHRVIRYDVRGFGQSSVPEGDPYSHHDDLKALLDYLGVSKGHIVGLSMGSGIAVDFVLAHPEMSRSLISVGPWVFGYNSPAAEEILQPMRELSSVVRERGVKAAADYLWEARAFKETVRDPAVLDALKEISYDYSFWHFTNEDPGRILDPAAVQQIDRISVPTLIITAEYDLEACREVADLLEQKVAGAKKIDIPATGHLMNMEKPGEFNRVLLDFLQTIVASNGT